MTRGGTAIIVASMLATMAAADLALIRRTGDREFLGILAIVTCLVGRVALQLMHDFRTQEEPWKRPKPEPKSEAAIKRDIEIDSILGLNLKPQGATTHDHKDHQPRWASRGNGKSVFDRSDGADDQADRA